jgi:hypothetical protein
MARDVAGLAAGMALLEPGFTVSAGPPAWSAGGDGGRPGDLGGGRRGARLHRWRISPVVLRGLDAAMNAAMTVLDAEAWESNAPLARSAPERIGRDVLQRLRAASEITPAALDRARQQVPHWRRRCRSCGTRSTCSPCPRCWASRPRSATRGRCSGSAGSPRR